MNRPPMKHGSPGPLPSAGAPPTMPDPGPPPRPSKSRHTIEVDVHTNVGIVRPGDKLVIALDRIPTQAEVNEVRERLAADLPGVEVVFIKANAMAVYRP